MQLPVVTIRGIQPSDEFLTRIIERAARLERYYRPILGCHVLVELDEARHRTGNSYHVRIELAVPGQEIVIRQRSTLHAQAQDLDQEKLTKRDDIKRERRYADVAVREAFAAARRRLRDHAQRRRTVAFHPLAPRQTPAFAH